MPHTLGRHVSTTDAGGTVYHAYDGIHCVADLAPDGRLLRAYTWGAGVDNLLAVTLVDGAATNTLYAVTDPLGTVHALIASDGTIAVSYAYDSWGNLLSASGSDSLIASLRFTWQGREYSYTTGLYNFRARWYDPAAGRWLSKDPIGLEGGLNLYEAFGNNPVCFGDPSGNVRDTIDGSIIEVHKYDVDTWPSSPHGHFVEDRNLKVAADGKIWNKVTKKVVGKLSKKGFHRFLKLLSRSLVAVSILSDFFSPTALADGELPYYLRPEYVQWYRNEQYNFERMQHKILMGIQWRFEFEDYLD